MRNLCAAMILFAAPAMADEWRQSLSGTVSKTEPKTFGSFDDCEADRLLIAKKLLDSAQETSKNMLKLMESTEKGYADGDVDAAQLREVNKLADQTLLTSKQGLEIGSMFRFKVICVKG